VAEHAHVIRVTAYSPADGRRQDVAAACRATSERARDADGCFGAQVCDMEEQPDGIAVVSRWRDRASLDAFLAASAPRLEELASLLSGPPVTVHYVSVD
jgi:quinol monooxygenase YgiN